jgi:hypothetical protein
MIPQFGLNAAVENRQGTLQKKDFLVEQVANTRNWILETSPQVDKNVLYKESKRKNRCKTSTD